MMELLDEYWLKSIQFIERLQIGRFVSFNLTNMKKSRRLFIKQISGSTAAVALGGVLPGFTAAQYKRIPGSSDRIRMAIIGTNSRGAAMAIVFARQPNTDIAFICDVEKKALQKGIDAVTKAGQPAPAGKNGFREILPDASVAIGHTSTLWVQLGNIAQRTGRTLQIDSTNGKILRDKAAMQYWGRSYEQGCKPIV